jgi:hypothetical protein
VLSFLDCKSGAVRILAADFSKAFDKLPFSSILSSLVKFQLPREAVVFLKNFLCDRQQRVSFDNCVSSWASISSGVPQGSVIGPFLFALVIDSLSPVCVNSTMIKYADDVTILHRIRNVSEDFLQVEWRHLEEWSDSVGLVLNFEKSCVTKNSLEVEPILTLNGSAIETVSSLRLLGITFSSNLSWNDHFSVMSSKCFKRFFILRNLKRAKCSPDLLFKCYSSFIRSLMLYGFSCFCNSPQYLLKKFFRVEKRASRFFKDYNFPSFLTVADKLCEDMFLNISNNRAHSLRCMFEDRVPTLRDASTVRAPLARTVRFKNSFIKYASR